MIQNPAGTDVEALFSSNSAPAFDMAGLGGGGGQPRA